MLIQDVRGMAQEAKRFTSRLAPRLNCATIVALSGELGAGKTTFAQAMAKALGVEEAVTSPTFVIEKTYQLPMWDLRSPTFERLVHIDAYRLKSAHELEALGWKELITDPGNLIVLEWPERVAEILPADAIRIRFDIHGDERTISINAKENDSEERRESVE